jgi:2'-5' RNA ligase
MIRAFVALDLDEARRSALAVQQFLLPLPRREPVENMHLTLAFLGEVPERLLEDVHEALQALRLPGFALELAGLGIFGGAHPRLVYAGTAPCPPLMHLQSKIETAARRAGAEVEGRRFLPHVTLGRFRPPGLEETMRLERAVAEQGGFRTAPMPVRDFALFESLPAEGRRRYEVLARYPLVSS